MADRRASFLRLGSTQNLNADSPERHERSDSRNLTRSRSKLGTAELGLARAVSGETDTLEEPGEEDEGGEAHALVGQDDGLIQLLDIATGAEVKHLSGHEDCIMAIEVNWEASLAVSVGSDGCVFFWDISLGVGSLIGPEDGCPRCCTRVLSVNWTPEDDRKAVTGNDDGRIVIWDISKKSEEKVLNCFLGMVHAICVDWTKLRILVSHGDTSLDLLSMKDGARLMALPTHHGMSLVLSVAWTKARAMVGFEDGALQVWSLRKQETEGSLKGHRSAVTTLQINWKLARAFSGSADKTVRLWHVKTYECLRIIGGHQEVLRTLNVDWDLGIALSSAWDGEMQLWEIADEAESIIQPVGGEARIGGVALLSVSEADKDDMSESGDES
eukprot:gb/GFBE01048599.1/.p1 GENE.gb/GFBE01048599.1/~~gb/GFBE01048599.1/.p1  ORF type:complete len:385 (+),score=84.81 gb/GFBE01048599.1/:1-1155(+)